MNNILITAAVFVLLAGSGLISMSMYTRLPEHHRDDKTRDAVRTIASIFIMMTSLTFGLLINSAKNTFEMINGNMHVYATDLIILDRMLRTYGSDANDARRMLIAYTEEAISHPARVEELLLTKSDSSGRALDAVGDALSALTPSDRFHETQLVDIRKHYNRMLKHRWAIVEHSEGSIPMPLMGMLVCWLMVVFTSFGYRAPRNTVVVTMILISAFLISTSVYLIFDMNVPFKGPIRVSDQPIHRALKEMQNP